MNLVSLFTLAVGAQLTLAQTESLLYSFKGGSVDGCSPYAGLLMDSNRNLYGTTENGGTHGYGTVYKLSPSGSTYAETTLYNFGGILDGKTPMSGLVPDASGNLYGTTASGGQTP